jgi:mono/diheme cytochrome c family protein
MNPLDRYVSPAELKRLISALLVVLLFISLAALFGFIVLPGLRYQAHTPDTPPVQGVPGETGWLDPTAYPAARKQVIPPLDPATVMKPNAELIEDGRKLFQSTCATCHGMEGKGDGPGGKGLNPPPRNFTQAAGWKNGYHIDQVYRTLDEGIKGTSMAAYRDIRRRDRMALVHYVRSLGSFDHGAGDPAALEALAKSFAGSGQVIPNRIPVQEAAARLAREFQAPPALPALAPSLQPYLTDPAKAAQTLAGIPGWQSSEAVLARGVVATLPGNGFSPAVATCSPAEWKRLRDGLLQK